MYCKYCGSLMKENTNFCKTCKKEMELDKIDVDSSTTTINVTQKKKKFPKKWTILILFIICCLCISFFTNDKEIKLGETIEMHDVIKISFTKGNFFEEEAYPSNATNKSEGLLYDGDGIMFALYGEVENISTEKYDLNKVVKATFIFDNKYETNVTAWLENLSGTEFEGLDSGDTIWLEPDALINPKANRKCTLLGMIGEEIYMDTTDITVEIQIQKDVDGKEYETYTMPLIIEEE